MTEFQPRNDDVDKLIPADLDEAFVIDGARRVLEGVWDPDNSEWREEYEAHRLLTEAGMVEPGVDLDRVAQAVADIKTARDLVDAVFEERADSGEDSKSN